MSSRYNHKIDRGHGRKSGQKTVKQSFLIVTEGVNTEPDYFTSFRLTSANVRVLGQGMSTLSLVRKAIFKRADEQYAGKTPRRNLYQIGWQSIRNLYAVIAKTTGCHKEGKAGLQRN